MAHVSINQLCIKSKRTHSYSTGESGPSGGGVGLQRTHVPSKLTRLQFGHVWSTNTEDGTTFCSNDDEVIVSMTMLDLNNYTLLPV